MSKFSAFMKSEPVCFGHRAKRWVASVVFVYFALALMACGRAEQPGISNTLKPSPELVLRQMSDRLARANQITFKVIREFRAAPTDGETEDARTEIDIAIERPNLLMAQSKGTQGVRSFYADGKNFSLVDQQMKLYAVVPSAGTIDELVERFDEEYGFTPPIAEFMLNDPYKRISRQIKNSSYEGTELINGVECHHVAAQGELADAELWVAMMDQLPRRLVATFKQREGNPQLRADFFEWNLTAALNNKIFSFVPPADAERIEMIPLARLKGEVRLEKKQGKAK